MSWTRGGSGATLFHSDDRSIQLSINATGHWSDSIPIPKVEVGKTPFTIAHASSPLCYQLAYSITRLPGPFCKTRVITLTSGVTLVNLTSEAVQVQLIAPSRPRSPVDESTLNVISVDAMSNCPWHKPANNASGSRVRIRSAGTGWSFGDIDVNEIGSNVLLLPRGHHTNTTAGDSGGLVVMHVEVKWSETDESSYLSVLFWRVEKEGTKDSTVVRAALSVQNLSDCMITIAQPVDASSMGYSKSQYELSIAPGGWRSFGWIDPAASHSIE